MSKLSYQLSVKRYQRELGLDARKFNALDVKYSDINLLKQLMLLNPVIVAPASAPPPAEPGWYGVLQIGNTGETGHNLNVRIDAVDGEIVNEILGQITMTSEDSNSDYYTFDLQIEDRLTSPSTILRVYYTPITGEVIDIATDAGLTVVNSYFGYIEVTVDAGYLIEGFLGLYFTLG